MVEIFSAHLGEQIAKSAIRLPGGQVYSEKRPARHGDLSKTLLKRGLKEEAAAGEQGFLTTLPRFVNKMDAAKIALASGQIQGLSKPEEGLRCEDVW